MYRIVLSKEASKYYRKVDKPARNRLDDAMDALANNPFDVQHHDIKPLHEPLRGLWRYRVGKFRVIYRVDKEASRVQIVTIRSRGEAY
ncbi:MAG: type II toxin-antitoxin system RelE/ParE family toxin [candidate division WOR-3 bacterium]|nr:type II toxin-antitoxin system RelE/ParE family toxin [candidate division WOR-3 bacterium]